MLNAHSRTLNTDRRNDIRLEGGGRIQAAIIDAEPWRVLDDPVIENISVGGMAILTSTRVEAGSRVVVWNAGGSPRDVASSVVLEVLDSADWQDGRRILRCRVVDGMVPASVIFCWESTLGAKAG